MDQFVTPYRICVSIFIKTYCSQRDRFTPEKHGQICCDILAAIRQYEWPFEYLLTRLERCDQVFGGYFRRGINETREDINNLFELMKQLRDCSHIENYSVAGLFLRKVTHCFDRLTHQGCSRLYEDLRVYASEERSGHLCGHVLHGSHYPRSTRTSAMRLDCFYSVCDKAIRPIHQANHEIIRLQTNELHSLSPKDLCESLKKPINSGKSDATFLRYLNLLRVNEAVGSKHLLLAYFDMVSDSVSRSYSPLNYAILYLHHGEYKRAIECLQECYCCAQAGDDDKCLLISLMWLARILIQAKQKNSSKYNVNALLELVRKRSQKSGMPYVQAMASLTLEQLNGPIDDSESLKKSTQTLKQVAQNSRQQNHLLAGANQPNPLDKEDGLPSAEVLAVRHSMNDVLSMYYALLSAHLSLIDANQSSALASQVLLHFDLIEKCGNENVFLMNENIFIAVRNLAHHVWNSVRDIGLVREILVDLCSAKIVSHRTDNHSIWRQALSEISFEYYMEQENWLDATKMISIIKETDVDGGQLRQAELLRLMGSLDEALEQVEELIGRIEFEESNLRDPVESHFNVGPNVPSNTQPNGYNSLVTANIGNSGVGSSEPSKNNAESESRSGSNNHHTDNPFISNSNNNKTNCKESGNEQQQKQHHHKKDPSSFHPVHPSLSIEHKAFIKSKALLLRATLLDDETKILESLQYATENRFLHVRTACLMELACRWTNEARSIVESIVIEVFANGTRQEKKRMRELIKI